MKALFGLLGSGLIAATLHTPQALALSEDELLDKYSEVPVFVVADADGGYVTSVIDLPNDGEGNVALLRVFFSEADVLSFVQQIRQEEPRFNQGGSVGVIDLASVHRIAKQEQELPIKLVFIPQAEALEAARSIDSDFGSGMANSLALIPLFALQDASGNYLSVSFGNEGEREDSIFSMFFSKQDADSVLEAIQESSSDLPEVNIGVVSLAELSVDLLSSDDEEFDRVRFLPDSEVINHIQSLNLE